MTIEVYVFCTMSFSHPRTSVKMHHNSFASRACSCQG